jgi:branched-chain amino acid transport system substrate-binding protein
VVAAASVAASVVAVAEPPLSAAGVIRPTYAIGFEGPLSGAFAQIGIDERNGALLAIRQANARGTLPFRLALVQRDDQGDPARAPAAAQALINRSAVRGVVGPSFSGASEAVGKRYADAHLGTVSPSASNPSLAHHGWRTFHRVVPDDNVEVVFAADWLDRLHRSRLYVLKDRAYTYALGVGRAVTREARHRGMHVTVAAYNSTASPKYRRLARRIDSSGIHTLFYAGYDDTAARLAKALSAVGYSGMRVSGSGVFSSVFTRNARAAGHGWYVTCGCMTRYATTAAKAFARAYRHRFGSAPGGYSAQGYDATNAIIRALKKAVANGSHRRRAVNKALADVNFAGVGTRVHFATNGNITRAAARVNLFQDRKGAFVQIGNIRNLPR